MDLTIYDVIKNIYMASKSQNLRDKFGKITFEVHKRANKPMIKEAIEKLWKVKVANIRTINVKGKEKAFGRRPFQTSGRKKAIITLKQGYKIDLPQFETMGAPGVKEEEAPKGK